MRLVARVLYFALGVLAALVFAVPLARAAALRSKPEPVCYTKTEVELMEARLRSAELQCRANRVELDSLRRWVQETHKEE